MSCTSCSSSNGTPKGCKNNGTCGTDGCNKLTVFDWLENMEPLADQKLNNIFEIRFKNGRKNYFKNSKDLSISIGDLVVVGAERGYDVGFVTLKGGLIPIQLKRKKLIQKQLSFTIFKELLLKAILTNGQGLERKKRQLKKRRES